MTTDENGNRIEVMAPINTEVEKSDLSGWYKTNLQYKNYIKVGNEWVEESKTSTVFIPAKVVEPYSWTEWVPSIDSDSGYSDCVSEGKTTTCYSPWFKVDEENEKRFQKGEQMFIPAGTPFYNHELKPYYTKDANGNDVVAKTIDTAELYAPWDGVNGTYDSRYVTVEPDGTKHIEWAIGGAYHHDGYLEVIHNNFRTNQDTQVYTLFPDAS